MPIKARTKMISFRLSDREYDRFRDFCIAQGTYSISELARAAVNKIVTDGSFVEDKMLEARINELEGQLHMLALELKRVKQVAAPQLLDPLAFSKGVG